VSADGDPDLPGLRERVERYDEASLLGKASMRLSHQAPAADERERVRRDRLRIEGRIAEDVARAVHASEPIWELLVQKDLPEDLSVRELKEIRDWLLGRRDQQTRAVASVSIRFTDDPERVAALAAAFPGDFDTHQVTAYRYATVVSEADGVEEPFIVALRAKDDGNNDVLATMLVADVFLRHEQEFGVLDQQKLETLATVIALDQRAIADTHRALAGA
jgi:hypothetical protein